MRKPLGVVLPGLVGCFLTCVASVAAGLLAEGSTPASGWAVFIERLGVGYGAASLVVVLVFPLLMPALLRWFDGGR